MTHMQTLQNTQILRIWNSHAIYKKIIFGAKCRTPFFLTNGQKKGLKRHNLNCRISLNIPGSLENILLGFMQTFAYFFYVKAAALGTVCPGCAPCPQFNK